MTDLATITKIPDVHNIGMNDVHAIPQSNICEVGISLKVTPITLVKGETRWNVLNIAR
jgi:hypothetical protein